jgi:hypothetical protein
MGITIEVAAAVTGLILSSTGLLFFACGVYDRRVSVRLLIVALTSLVIITGIVTQMVPSQ